MKPVELFLAKLATFGHEARKAGNGWSARCPAHDDRNPSLSITEGDDGRALIKCHAGCRVEAICEAIGLCVGDLMPTADTFLPISPQTATAKVSKRKGQIAARYDYHDEAGNLLFQVVRYAPKDFRQRRPDSYGKWTWNVKGVRVVPYRLRELLADAALPVFIVEGEKDADTLAGIGVVVTCNSGGAGKWTQQHSEFLRGRIVYVVADNDKAGREHAHQVARSLHAIAASVRIVKLLGLPPKGDVSDWIAAGGTREKLLVLAEAAPLWTPTDSEAGPVLKCMSDVAPRSVSWLWPNRVPLGRITLLVGRPGEGKSFLTTDMASRVSTGTPWPDGGECPQGSVILISAEDDPADTIRPRLDAHTADVRHVHLLAAVRSPKGDAQRERMITLADLEAIEAALEKLQDCKLVVVDPIGSFLGGKTDAHRDNEVRGVLAPIAALAEKHGPAVLVVAHRRKSSGSVADDLALGSRAFTGIARAVWHLARDGDNKGRRLLLPGKNNLAREGSGLAFSIIGEPARISWESEPVTMNADDALAAENKSKDKKPGPEAESLESASAWLSAMLTNGPRFAGELLDEWKNGQGGSDRTLKRAKKSLNVEAYRIEIPGKWWWRLPDKLTDETDIGSLGILAESAGETVDTNVRESMDAKLADAGTLVKTAEGPKRVCQCGSTTWRDVTIHEGKSTRRDCALCGRFLGFSNWQGTELLDKMSSIE